MEQQGYRCAGCSMKVALKYASKFRYCFYLGRYFCTGCHVNNTAIIPGRIIAKWDFSKYVVINIMMNNNITCTFFSGQMLSQFFYFCVIRYPVSSFSHALLEQMLYDPLFNIIDLNSVLYKRVRSLEKVRSYRLQLYYIKDFILSCRYADRWVSFYARGCIIVFILYFIYSLVSPTQITFKTILIIIIMIRLKELLDLIEAHIILKPDVYSIQNMLDVKNGELSKRLQNIIVTCNKHVANCQVKIQKKSFWPYIIKTVRYHCLVMPGERIYLRNMQQKWSAVSLELRTGNEVRRLWVMLS